jgi:hypothetical protein
MHARKQRTSVQTRRHSSAPRKRSENFWFPGKVLEQVTRCLDKVDGAARAAHILIPLGRGCGGGVIAKYTVYGMMRERANEEATKIPAPCERAGSEVRDRIRERAFPPRYGCRRFNEHRRTYVRDEVSARSDYAMR